MTVILASFIDKILGQFCNYRATQSLELRSGLPTFL